MQRPQSGSIEVITGPMFSGKSEELIRRLRRAQIARLETKVFKHHADNRYSAEHVVSHSEWRFPSRTVAAAEEILRSVGREESSPNTSMMDWATLEVAVAVVGIDEAHFFDYGIVEVARSLARRGVRVIIAGLDLDYRGQPFGFIPQLLAMAEEVTKLHAICVQCGAPAHFSQRLVPSVERVLVGARETYEARCRNCFTAGAPARLSIVPAPDSQLPGANRGGHVVEGAHSLDPSHAQ